MSGEIPNAKAVDLEIEGQVIHYTVSGDSKPVIVFLNGHRISQDNWNNVVPHVSKIGTTITYDRLDAGKSGKSKKPQDGNTIITALDALLRSASILPPYILVAHSLGGLYANLYARRHPDNVIAVIFVEASHPSEAELYSITEKPKSGALGKLKAILTPDFKKDPNSEFNNVAKTVEEIESAPDFPSIYLTVITGGKKMPFVPKEAFDSHMVFQKKLTALSPSGRQIMARKSGHVPQISEPDLVVQAIASAVESVKR